jgi:hypothetical protein
MVRAILSQRDAADVAWFLSQEARDIRRDLARGIGVRIDADAELCERVALALKAAAWGTK